MYRKTPGDQTGGVLTKKLTMKRTSVRNIISACWYKYTSIHIQKQMNPYKSCKRKQ